MVPDRAVYACARCSDSAVMALGACAMVKGCG
jgi:hypothetical protein